MQCEEGSILVTWAANPDAESFHVTAVTSSGPPLSCNSMNTGCSIVDMPCGHSYTVTVTAIRDDCESEDSEAVQVSTGMSVSVCECVTQSIPSV